MARNRSTQRHSRHPAPSPAAFKRSPLLTADYTKKSFEDTKVFVEKLSGVKSLEKAIEIQTEFAKTAYETFVTNRRRLPHFTAILPSNPTSRSVAIQG